jgi:uroporphyrinogen decarboxylase
MTSKERILSIINGEKPDRIPFSPAVYEHKAALINRLPSEVCRDIDLLTESIKVEYKTYHPDILVVGIDIYNIEAEALGCEINYEHGIGVPTIKSRILNNSNLKEMKIPNPQKDGRMPLIIKTTEEIQKTLGNEVYVCASVSGPFSLASSLMGDENILIALIEKSDYITEILKFTTSVCKVYTSAILETGADVMIFDSATAPPLISPNQYKETISPNVKDLFDSLSSNGSKLLSYIVGGNTANILEYFIEAGAKNIICDFNADLNVFLEKSKKSNILIRKNFSPSILMSQSIEEIEQETLTILNQAKNYNRFIFGTGILPYNIDKEKVLKLKDVVNNFY